MGTKAEPRGGEPSGEGWSEQAGRRGCWAGRESWFAISGEMETVAGSSVKPNEMLPSARNSLRWEAQILPLATSAPVVYLGVGEVVLCPVGKVSVTRSVCVLAVGVSGLLWGPVTTAARCDFLPKLLSQSAERVCSPSTRVIPRVPSRCIRGGRDLIKATICTAPPKLFFF